MRNFLKLRKNRTYDYSPRYYKGEGNPYKIEHKLDKYRSTAHSQRGLKNKITSAVDDLKNEGDRNLKIRFLVIVAVLILLFLFIIDFDLSIFLNP
ncbi:riboflavin synthase subunit beta [Flagellimonas hymeniacidonis]|uniref:Riboflavin synthase subunit beta n=1 Tax=Flagellimonas hymeniacidonis TaxID=2603628 RepID=A0A5C8V2M5_9FLAO|nr:riboflavin synthase subunit beta [Flagellimonas hymeniacidonis]TXN35175.1 riboflavin synthase subunit beta [Flagellimonas hymeniacidonis]